LRPPVGADSVGNLSGSTHIQENHEVSGPIVTLFQRLAVVAFAAVTAACTYEAGYHENPIFRSFSWFSYLGGEDIRSACLPGASDRYRIVYNGTWDEQVRTYDIAADGKGGASLVLQVSGDLDVSQIRLNDPLGPWRGKILRRDLSAAEFRAIREALHASGFDAPPPGDMRLQSWGFFWLAAACEGGEFAYNGWAYPSERFDKVKLAPPLLAVDESGIKMVPPRDTDRPRAVERQEKPFYELAITRRGIRDNFTPF
jgi:hypothetical protein